MSEIMRPIPFSHLMDWALREYEQQGRIFGVQKEKFYKNESGKYMTIFGQKLSSPIGPAAGPNSQLAQNIIAAYLGGARFMELKTVQKMDGDELRACVPRPCINAEDEGYNVEWSTELTVPQAFEEYVKAWVAIHALSKELGLAQETDFAFNMSVGYDLDGIKTDKINDYIEGMKNAADTAVFKDSIAWLNSNIGRFKNYSAADVSAISPQVSNSVTLSTLHGCPPQEIERIAKYLLEEKKVNTFVKCNPTLLGYEFARNILNEMGYHYISFDEHHFNNDLQYTDAVAMLGRLLEYGTERNLAFGVKITNTFPVQIKRKELPGEEMYMSGRSLFPLSISVANKLSQDFNGKLTISYSGGADAFNIADIFKTGIQPITVATTILKPGGYERLKQLSEILEPEMKAEWAGVDVAGLKAYAESVAKMPFYRKDQRPVASRKTDVPLPLFDCYQAPCKNGGCPIEQAIPLYLNLVAQGKYDEAFRVIAVDNANPGVTGTICNHACQGKCTRLDYDSSLEIRNAKLLAVQAAQEAFIRNIQPCAIKSDKKAVVVGAGPAGVSAALFLRRNGVDVTVLEKRDRPFGIVEYVIPEFRISAETIKKDFEMAEKYGVNFKFNVSDIDVAALQKEYDFVVLAIGAWKEGAAAVKEGQEKLLDALAFLEESKVNNCKVALGKQVAVIGGGDVAMDCARAAKRAPGVEKVTIVYRRTRDFMPAEPEEIRLALEDGVEMVELHAPLSYDGKTLACEEMLLGDWDDSGRRGIIGTGKNDNLSFDTVICAVGARVDNTLFEASGVALDGRGRPVVSAACESSLKNVYIAGDCKAGPSTVVAAIADGKHIAIDILAKLGIENDFIAMKNDLPVETLYDRKGVMVAASKEKEDGDRCLSCAQLCELCCDVCPNRANVRIPMPGFANSSQILHVDGMCNECGNCGIFCPHKGDPYKDKVTVFWSEEDFHDSTNRGFFKTGEDEALIRLEDGSTFTAPLSDARIPAELSTFIRAIIKDYSYYIG